MSSLIKEINRYVKHLLLKKTSILSERKFEEMHYLSEKKGTRYIRGNIYFCIIVFSCYSSTKTCLRFLLICFAQEIEGFYHSSLGNKVDFRDIMSVSPNILAKNKKFKKLRHSFVYEIALITTTFISSCH